MHVFSVSRFVDPRVAGRFFVCPFLTTAIRRDSLQSDQTGFDPSQV